MQLKFNIETAYLLGLLWGDGHARKKYGYLVLNMGLEAIEARRRAETEPTKEMSYPS